MRRRFVTIGPEESLLEAHQLMRLARLRHLVVVSEERLIGMVSFRDIQAQILTRLCSGELEDIREYLNSLRVHEAIVHPGERAAPDTPLDQAAAHLVREQIACLPVTEETPGGPRLLGLVTESDLLRAAYGGRSCADPS